MKPHFPSISFCKHMPLPVETSSCKALCLAPHLQRASALTLSHTWSTWRYSGHEFLMDEETKPPEAVPVSPLPEPSQLLSQMAFLSEPHARLTTPEGWAGRAFKGSFEPQGVISPSPQYNSYHHSKDIKPLLKFSRSFTHIPSVKLIPRKCPPDTFQSRWHVV